MKEMILKFWKKRFGKDTAGQVMNPVGQPTEAVASKSEKAAIPSPMLERLEAYLFSHYDFHFNVLTEQSEYAPKDKEAFVEYVEALKTYTRWRSYKTPFILQQTLGI